MKKFMISILVTLSVIYIGLGVLMALKQRSILYFPTSPILHHHPIKEIRHDGVTLSLTKLNAGQSQAILYFGGNGEMVDLNAGVFLKDFPDHTVYLVNYRGYGLSTGTPTEKGLYADALKIYDVLKDKHSNISVIGRSLGSGVATYLASKREIDKLVLVTPFDSILAVAQKQFPIYPVRWMLQDQYDSYSRVKNIKAKTLIIIAQNDHIIKKPHSLRLAEKFPKSQISLKIIKNSGHNTLSQQPEYYKQLMNFMK